MDDALLLSHPLYSEENDLKPLQSIDCAVVLGLCVDMQGKQNSFKKIKNKSTKKQS